MRCLICDGELGGTNKSGYCTHCYHYSPFYKTYQSRKQKEWYAKLENKQKRKDYANKPKVRARIKKYQKEYQINNKERLRELKRNWAIKNRLKICCLCKQKFAGYGNNAQPLKKGRCCDKCDQIVILERIKSLKGGINK